MEINAEMYKRIPWNKGKKGVYSKEYREKISAALRKRPRTEAMIDKWRKTRAGYQHSEETKEKIRLANAEKLRNLAETKRGIKRDPAIGRKISEKKKGIAYFSGETHWNWKGGLSKNPYPKEFNNALKQKIRERDNFTCCLCGRLEQQELEELNRRLSVNHIDFDKNNCSESNLNTLCLRCNVKINRERDYWTSYFQHYGEQE